MFKELMYRKRVYLIVIAILITFSIIATVSAATLQQNLSDFVDLRFGMFIHFNMGTFTDEEWASPNWNPTTFAPTNVDCNQWANAAVAAKMKFGILTTKHHDGFCLWPSAYTTYDVMSSSYQQDIVQKFVDAFRAKGLKIGIYYSIWDKTQDVQAYTGRHGVSGTKYIDQADIDFSLNQIRELLTNYGTIDIFITDGYGWQAGQQAVPMQQVRELVKSLQPNCIMIDHGGLSTPYLGDAIYFEEPLGVTSPAGNTFASCQGQTISNGWFWHPSTPTTEPMSLSSILSHLTDLEPKYTTFILNCPPNRNGVLDTNIVNRLTQVGQNWNPNTSRSPLPTQQVRTEHPVTPRSAYATSGVASYAIDGRSDKNFESLWTTSGTLPQSITIDLGGVYSNISTLEYLPKQWGRNGTSDGNITSFTIFKSTDGVNFTQIATGTWANDFKLKIIEWTATSAAYIRIQVNAGTGSYGCASEFTIGGRLSIPSKTGSTVLFNGVDYFKIINYTNGLAVDGGGSVPSGSNLKQWTWDGSPNLQWRIIDLGNGYFKLINRTNGLAIDNNDSTTQGSTLVQKTDSGTNAQQWQLTNIGAGGYRLTNRASGMVMDSGGSVPSGSIVKQWGWDGSTNLMWRIERIHDQTLTPTPTPTPTVTPGGPTPTPTPTGLPPVVWYKFDESSGTTAADSSGNGKNGTLVNGPTWVTGKAGNAVNLDGSNDYVSMPTGILSSLNDFSITAWVKLDTISNWMRIFDFGTGTNVNMFLTPCSGSSVIRYAITTGSYGSEQQINGTAVLGTGSWQHVAVTLSGSLGILYVNGAEVGRNSSMTLKPSSLGSTNQNYIGKSQYSDPYLDGLVDSFRIYNRALSASEVSGLFTAGN